MSDPRRTSRRHFLAATVGACAVVPAISASAQIGTRGLGSLTKAERDRLTPSQVLDALRQGNERFRTGKLEFACAVAGAKVLLLFGHTACGAIKGAIDDVEMGNLTGLLARVKPAITATAFDGDKSSKTSAYVDAVARTNVRLGLDTIRRRSSILAGLEKEKALQMVGGMYDLVRGAVELVD